MAGDLKIGIRLDADGKSFVGEMRLARRELDKLAGGTRKAGAATAAYTRAYSSFAMGLPVKNSAPPLLS